MAVALGKNCLKWCRKCNMAVVSADRCPKCGSKSEEVPVSTPWDIRPAFERDVEIIRRAADEKYGEGCGLDLIPDDRAVFLNDNARGNDSVEIVVDGEVIGAIVFRYDMKWHIYLDLPGLMRIQPHIRRFTVTANHSGMYSLKGRKNLMVGGVKDCDPDLKIGDKVAILSDKGCVIGCGQVNMPPSELKVQERGMFVKVKERKKDDIRTGPPVNWKTTVRWNAPVIEKMVKEGVSFMKRIIREHPELPYAISFSGGKDSQAVLMLAVDGKLRPKIVFADTGLEYPETVEFVDSYIKRHRLELVRAEASFETFLRNMKTFGPPAYGYRWCCKTNKLSAISASETKAFPNGSLQFIGQRRYESVNRMRIGRISTNPWIPNQVTAMPIQEWNALHVWMYIALRGEPFNPKYEQGMPRIGCILCPFMSLAEIEMNKGSSEKYERWFQGIVDYGRSRGMPDEWAKYHLWRHRKLPMDVYKQVGPLCGKSYEELTKRTLPPVRVPLKMRMQEGFSPCILGYSVEAALSRPVDIRRLKEFGKILGQEIELEEGAYVSIGNITVYAEGVIISKGGDLNEVKGAMRTVFEILVKSEECCGCKQCVTRCPSGALTLVSDKVEMDPSKCISCRRCLCPCPSVRYSTE